MTADPFDRLEATTDDTVDALFAARLKARVQRALGLVPDRVSIDVPSRARVAGDTVPTRNVPTAPSIPDPRGAAP